MHKYRLPKRPSFKVIALACAALLMAPIGGVAVSSFALAKNNGGGGNGGGGNHGGGNGGGGNHGGGSHQHSSTGHGKSGAAHGKAGAAATSTGKSANAHDKKASKVQVASTKKPEDGKPKHGSLASKLGALNAAHASASAFAHASPNSRIGKLRTYYEANAAAEQAAEKLDGLRKAVDDANKALTDAQAAGVTDVTALQQAVTDAKTALATAQATATQLEADADAALKAAANKEVTDEVKAEVDRLLEGKIAQPATEPETTVTN